MAFFYTKARVDVVFAGESRKRKKDVANLRQLDATQQSFHYEFHSKKPSPKTINGHTVHRADLDTTLVARTIERIIRGAYDPTREEIENLFLLSGDGDYVPLLDTARSNRVKRIMVAGPRGSISGELARKADFTIHLDKRFTAFIDKFATNKLTKPRKKKRKKRKEKS